MSVPSVGSGSSQSIPLTFPASQIPSTPVATTPSDTITSATTHIGYQCLSCVSSTFDIATYPARFALSLLTRFTLFRVLFSPLEFIYNKVVRAYDAVRYMIEKRYATPQMQFSQQQLEQIQRQYWALGDDKWKEGVESHYHIHGRYVFDQGLHQGSIEPGFHRNWNRSVYFLSHQFQQKMCASLYLRLHTIACSHFLGATNDTLMGQDKVGVFRGSDDHITWNCNGRYIPTAEARQELAIMNAEIIQRFGVTLANFVDNTDGSVTLRYTTMSREKAGAIYDYFSANLYAELERAQNPDDKLTAICKFFRNSEWLHSVRDGCGRCDLMTFNFLLTQNGFHPTTMQDSYLASTTSLANWVTYVRGGLANWEGLVRAGA